MPFTTFLHPYIGAGRATLAIWHDPLTKHTKVGVAYASPKDKFTRAKGRLIATNRLESELGHYFEFNANPELRIKQQVLDVFCEYTVDVGPNWANKFLTRHTGVGNGQVIRVGNLVYRVNWDNMEAEQV